MNFKIILAVLTLIKQASSAKILALMLVASHSHHYWNSKYLEALVKKGHHVTYLSLDEYKNPPENITHILVEGLYENLYSSMDLTSMADGLPYQHILSLHRWDNEEAEFAVKSKAMRQLSQLIKVEKFDLVVHDIGCCSYLLGAVDVLGRPPVIGITAFGVPLWTLEILGNPMTFSSKPHFLLPYSDIMNFLQRANNYFLHLFSFAVRWFSLRIQNEYSKRCFGNDIRSLDQIFSDINIVLVNSNRGFDYEFPKVSGLIPVGGLHIQESEPLSSKLKKFLDEAKNGVVYFSLGSNIQSSKLEKEKIDVLTKAFEQISPVQVLWKWETHFFFEKPKNVKIEKWLPQKDVLAHPNVRLFFTHSGLLSTQEAIYHGKPIVGMPFFLDQHVNVNKCVEKGFGEKLNYNELTVEKIVTTIRKILNNTLYEENVRKASALFRDQMESPLDRAVYWTEYAIRHKGAPHLRHAARNLSFLQNWMLDVLILTTAFIFLALFSIYKLTAIISSRMFFSSSSKLKKN